MRRDCFFPEFSKLSWIFSRYFCVCWATLSTSKHLLIFTIFSEHPLGGTVLAFRSFCLLLGISYLFAGSHGTCSHCRLGTGFESQNFINLQAGGRAGEKPLSLYTQLQCRRTPKKRLLGPTELADFSLKPPAFQRTQTVVHRVQVRRPI